MSESIAPSFRWMLSHPCHLVSLGFGSGLSPVAPGTVGTVVSIPVVLGLWAFTPFVALSLWLIFTLLGIFCCHRTAQALGGGDPSPIVFDEWLGMGYSLIVCPRHFSALVLAFALFRLLDIFKPGPIGWADRHLKGGLGIVLDDVLAGLFAGALVYLSGWAAARFWGVAVMMPSFSLGFS